MAPRREAIPEADVEPAARPLVAVDGRDEGDGGGVEKRRQAADRERGCLVDDDGVRIVGEPTRLDGGEKSHAAAAGRGDGVIVATCQFSQRSEQGRGALEHLRGVAVGGGGDEDVPARGGEAPGGEHRHVVARSETARRPENASAGQTRENGSSSVPAHVPRKRVRP